MMLLNLSCQYTTMQWLHLNNTLDYPSKSWQPSHRLEDVCFSCLVYSLHPFFVFLDFFLSWLCMLCTVLSFSHGLSDCFTYRVSKVLIILWMDIVSVSSFSCRYCGVAAWTLHFDNLKGLVGRAHRPPLNAQLPLLLDLDETNKHYWLLLLLFFFFFFVLSVVLAIRYGFFNCCGSCHCSYLENHPPLNHVYVLWACMPLEKRIKDTKHVGLQTRLASCSQDQGEYLAFQMEKREKRNQHLHQVANPDRISLWHFAADNRCCHEILRFTLTGDSAICRPRVGHVQKRCFPVEMGGTVRLYDTCI